MKINKNKLFLYGFSTILLLVLVGVLVAFSYWNKVNKNIVPNRVDVQTPNNVSHVQELPLHQLKDIARGIIKGTILSSQYGYEDGIRIVEFDITDANGIDRELTLYASDGKIYDIDYDYDEQGNRFINQSHFDVNITFEQAKDIAISNVQGSVLAYKQDVDKGLFIYNFAIQEPSGDVYEVHVETKDGRVLKVKTHDDYNYDDYIVNPIDLSNSNVVTDNKHDEPVQEQENQNFVSQQTEHYLQQNQGSANQYQNSSYKSEEELRQIVLSKVPGVVEYYYKDWDDGILEYNYKIKTSDNTIAEVEINADGWITDIDYDNYVD